MLVLNNGWNGEMDGAIIWTGMTGWVRRRSKLKLLDDALIFTNVMNRNQAFPMCSTYAS